MCGVEYFALPWEVGARRAKELMLTGDSIDADEAHRIGMVSKIFPRAELEDSTLAFARRLARINSMAALLIKESVNQTVDNQGFHNAINACFTLHELNHAHWAALNDDKYPLGRPEHGVPAWNEAPPVVPRARSVADPHAPTEAAPR
jgi:enoyl-CoA hydratase